MNVHKRLSGIIGVSILALGLASCAPKNNTGPENSVNTASSKKRIVFVFKVDGLLYSNVCKSGAVKAGKELASQNVQVDYMAPKAAQVADQISIIQQLIAEKVNAIIISPNDAEGIVPILKRAEAAGTKVYTWDSDAPSSPRRFYLAAADDVQIGVDIATSLAKEVGGKGKVQIVSGGQGAANLNLHVQGMEQGFAKFPGITIVKPYIYNDDDNTRARSMAIAALQKDPDIVGFACANSPSAPAVGEAVTSLGKIGKVRVWGLALPSETRQYLKSGAVSGLMLWDPAKLTYLAALLVNDELNGKKPQDGKEYPEIGKIRVKDGRVLMPGITINKQNVDEFKF